MHSRPGHGNRARLFRRAQPPPEPGTNFAGAAAPGRVPTPGWCGLPSQGVRGAVRPSPAVPSAPLGSLDCGHRAACAPSGLLTRTAGRGGAARPLFPNPRTTYDFASLPTNFDPPGWKLLFTPKGGFLRQDETSLRLSRACSGLAPAHATDAQIFSLQERKKERVRNCCSKSRFAKGVREKLGAGHPQEGNAGSARLSPSDTPQVHRGPGRFKNAQKNCDTRDGHRPTGSRTDRPTDRPTEEPSTYWLW